MPQYLDQGNIKPGVGAHQPARHFPAVIQVHLKLLGPGHHVVVGEDITPGVDDDAGAPTGRVEQLAFDRVDEGSLRLDLDRRLLDPFERPDRARCAPTVPAFGRLHAPCSLGRLRAARGLVLPSPIGGDLRAIVPLRFGAPPRAD